MKPALRCAEIKPAALKINLTSQLYIFRAFISIKPQYRPKDIQVPANLHIYI